MYARLVLFTLGPGMRSTAEKIVGWSAASFKAQKGFKGATFLGDDDRSEYGGLTLWESKEDAEVAFEALFPQLQEALAGIIQGPPITKLFEVFEPTA